MWARTLCAKTNMVARANAAAGMFVLGLRKDAETTIEADPEEGPAARVWFWEPADLEGRAGGQSG